MNEARTYSTNDMVRLTGLSYKQLQWWDEQGLLVPGRTPNDWRLHRAYSEEQLRLAKVLHGLRIKGVSLQRLRRVWPSVEHYVEKGFRFVGTDGVEAYGTNVLSDLALDRSGVAVVQVEGA